MRPPRGRPQPRIQIKNACGYPEQYMQNCPTYPPYSRRRRCPSVFEGRITVHSFSRHCEGGFHTADFRSWNHLHVFVGRLLPISPQQRRTNLRPASSGLYFKRKMCPKTRPHFSPHANKFSSLQIATFGCQPLRAMSFSCNMLTPQKPSIPIHMKMEKIIRLMCC
jgi:hypothetical protein